LANRLPRTWKLLCISLFLSLSVCPMPCYKISVESFELFLRTVSHRLQKHTAHVILWQSGCYNKFRFHNVKLYL
jgi:hypothetical protein